MSVTEGSINTTTTVDMIIEVNTKTGAVEGTIMREENTKIMMIKKERKTKSDSKGRTWARSKIVSTTINTKRERTIEEEAEVDTTTTVTETTTTARGITTGTTTRGVTTLETTSPATENKTDNHEMTTTTTKMRAERKSIIPKTSLRRRSR